MAVLDMQLMRYINLLDRASRVKTSTCFVYNNIIYFAVPRSMMSKAIGPDATNVKSIQEQLGRKIKIIKEAEGREDSIGFISDVVSPVTFKSAEIKDNILAINAGNTQTKASLIGRNRRREEELKKIVKDVFDLELKIV
jgi:transcription antitermination factor NusA-like protein